MRVIRLKRIVHDSNAGTFGVLIFDDLFPYFTSIELPWKSNAHDISCIPAGEYLTSKIISPHFKYDVYELQNVPNRQNIEMHIANSIYDINGCIGIGRAFGIVETNGNGLINGIQDSRFAFAQFMAKLANDQNFKLVIED